MSETNKSDPVEVAISNTKESISTREITRQLVVPALFSPFAF
jgi:hypothetical protein